MKRYFRYSSGWMVLLREERAYAKAQRFEIAPYVPKTIMLWYLCSIKFSGVGDEAKIIDNIWSVKISCLDNFLVKRMVVSDIVGGVRNPSVKPCIAVLYPLPL